MSDLIVEETNLCSQFGQTSSTIIDGPGDLKIGGDCVVVL
jgi:hypothetical protein